MWFANQYYGSLNNGVSVSYFPINAFGFRYGLIPGYSGGLFKIRRSSDNTTLECFSIADATTFVGAGDGFVEIWRNQSGVTANDLVQTTLANQPKLIKAGVLQTINSKPALLFERSTDFLATNSSIMTRDIVESRSVHFVQETTRTLAQIIFSQNLLIPATGYGLVSTQGDTNTNIQSIAFDPANFRLIKNGLSITVPTTRAEVYNAQNGSHVLTYMDFGFTSGLRVADYRANTTFKWTGKIAEIQIYSKAPGTFNLAIEEANNLAIKNYFGL